MKSKKKNEKWHVIDNLEVSIKWTIDCKNIYDLTWPKKKKKKKDKTKLYVYNQEINLKSLLKEPLKKLTPLSR